MEGETTDDHFENFGLKEEQRTGAEMQGRWDQRRVFKRCQSVHMLAGEHQFEAHLMHGRYRVTPRVGLHRAQEAVCGCRGGHSMDGGTETGGARAAFPCLNRTAESSAKHEGLGGVAAVYGEAGGVEMVTPSEKGRLTA